MGTCTLQCREFPPFALPNNGSLLPLWVWIFSLLPSVVVFPPNTKRDGSWSGYPDSIFVSSCFCIYTLLSTNKYVPSYLVLIPSAILLPLTRSLFLYFEYLSQVVMRSFMGQMATLERSSYQYFRIISSLKRREPMEGLLDLSL